MKKKYYLIAILALMSCTNQTKNEKKDAEINKITELPFYLGTYTDGESKSEGIYKFVLLSDGKLKQIGLAAKTISPSFLAYSADKNFVVAVNEISENNVGSVELYKIEGDSLVFVNKQSTGGAHPCYVGVNAQNYVVAANYTGGNVGLLQITKENKLSELLNIQQHKGKGTTPRQEKPHAHSAWFDASGFELIAVDLGTNELWFSHLDTLSKKLKPTKQNKLAMAEAAGPRHLCFHPNTKWIYVVNELNSTISHLEKNNAENYEIKNSISTLPTNYKEPNTCADIHISADGKFVYASNRGHNSIAIFKVNEQNGDLTFVAHESTKGNGPRNFALSPNGDFLLVANQKTNNIVSFGRNANTGLLTFVHEIEAPTPVCILF